ncbi:O-antigen ligase family protein [Ensifer soli]|uniref:O-antigen ligase family protein n=1 Tax=Ciceribacter sp. sgz301302 TaxID=3342379 RepID=UPI0035B6FFE0
MTTKPAPPSVTIAVPSLSDGSGKRVVAVTAALLSGFGLFIIVLTLIPFLSSADNAARTTNEGNMINQVGYLGLGGIYLFAMMVIVERKLLLRLISPSWIVIFAIAFASCLQSYDPTAAARGLTQSLIAMILVAGTLTLPRSERDFVQAGANAMLILILIDYAALVVAPDRAIHSAAGGEPWHAGFWRGHLLHKNVSAPVFSILAMFGIYCIRSGLTLRGTLITLLAVNFVLHTGSKTTLGFLPIAIGLVLGGRMIGRPGLTIVAHLFLTVVIFGLTVGTVFSPTLLAATSAILADATFTGRDAIWDFAIASIPDKLWFGHGYASFWLSPVIMAMEKNFEASWDVRGIVTGHNTYIDAVLTFGLPGGLIMIFLIFFKPLLDYLGACRLSGASAFADFCAMAVIFMTYAAMLESFVLNRADPMWMLTALAVFGLGLAARHPLRGARKPAPDIQARRRYWRERLQSYKDIFI